MVIFGFYGAPMLFISYGSSKVALRVYDSIVPEGLSNNQEIASQLSMPENDVKNNIQMLINRQYLVGYLFIFANSSSTQADVDINDLSIYGTVDNNDSILFNNGTNFSAKNVVINQKWGK